MRDVIFEKLSFEIPLRRTHFAVRLSILGQYVFILCTHIYILRLQRETLKFKIQKFSTPELFVFIQQAHHNLTF